MAKNSVGAIRVAIQTYADQTRDSGLATPALSSQFPVNSSPVLSTSAASRQSDDRSAAPDASLALCGTVRHTPANQFVECLA